jgi:hypothetical protein
MDLRLERLDEPHVRPLMALIERMRASGLKVPNADPNDGGVDARVLVLLERVPARKRSAPTSFLVTTQTGQRAI